MEGNSKVDALMFPVMAAIRRHVENPDAVTDIYNRAYEAVMNSMTVMDTMRDQLSKANAHAEAAEARVAELEAEREWRPMETAPKDGTFILIVCREGYVNKVSWEEDVVFCPGITKWPYRWCVYGSFQDEQGGYETVDHPVGWRPLPPPPVTPD